MRGAAFLRDLEHFLLPHACVSCADAVPPELDGPVCLGCRLALRSPPAPLCDRCGISLGTRVPLAGARNGEAAYGICGECRDWPAELRSARAAVVLAPPADDLVHGLKYEGWTALAPVMAERMGRVVWRRGRESTVVVPVPTTRRRRRRRGYNQAALLARALSRRLERRFATPLERTSEGPTQVSLPPDQRLANVKNAFSVKAGETRVIAGRSVLLVDDVLTTGATAGEVARTLVAAGADEVHLVTFARALQT